MLNFEVANKRSGWAERSWSAPCLAIRVAAKLQRSERRVIMRILNSHATCTHAYLGGHDAIFLPVMRAPCRSRLIEPCHPKSSAKAPFGALDGVTFDEAESRPADHRSLALLACPCLQPSDRRRPRLGCSIEQ